MRCSILRLVVLAAFIALAATVPAYSEANVMVVSYAGNVKIFPPGSDEPVECRPGIYLQEDTRIITGAESYAEVAFDRQKSNLIKVKDNSEVILKLNGPDKIELVSGKVFTLLRDVRKGETFRVRTPGAVCGARGTGWATCADGPVTDISVFDDRVFVRGVNPDGTAMEKEYWVRSGFRVTVRRNEKPSEQTKIPPDALGNMWSEFGITAPAETGRDRMADITNKDDRIREQQVERLREKKDDNRLDDIREKPEENMSSDKNAVQDQ